MSKQQQKSLWQWLDNNILLLLGGFLLAFIPLYPKLPLFEAIPGYIVRVRLEDVLILLTGVIWLVQVIRGKVSWKTPLTPFIVAYAVIGLVSALSAIFIIGTVPLEPLHVGKTFLHYFRYLEYFALFFFLSSAMKSKKELKSLFTVILVTLVGISIYGIGQKFLYWPVYSTMNREFSKGVRLYLTEHARVQSTFGGHYDLAGYLVIILPILLALILSLKRRVEKLLLGGLFLLGLWLLIVSASRTSFIAFNFAVGVVVLLKALQRTSLKEKLLYLFSRFTVVMLVVLVMVSNFGDDITERLVQAIEGYPIIYDNYTIVADASSDFVEASEDLADTYILVPLGITEETKDKIRNRELAEKPDNALSTEEAEVLVSSDERPTPQRPDRPSDVYEDIPDKKKVATTSADGTTTTTEIEVPRVYSENALKYGLSVAIRLDYLWPKAIEGFMKNPLLGSGYATLTKESTYHFTEAESTDNNFLRTLGETGLLGFIVFYGAVVFAMYWAYRLYKKDTTHFVTALSVGYIAGSAGLLLNATYIDVFAASKVAFTYWSITGLLFAIVAIEFGERAIPFNKQMKHIEEKIHRVTKKS